MQLLKIRSKISFIHLKVLMELSIKVSFFLMEKIDGEISNHDDEFDKVYWEKWDSALNKLSYQGEKDVLEKAIKLAKDC